MKHYVFSAANIPNNKEAIERALDTVTNLEWLYDMNATATGVYEGSDFIVNHDDGGNTSIYAEDSSDYQIIESCMDFAREYERLKYKIK